MITCDTMAAALTAVALCVGATIVLACAFVSAYIVRKVRTWQRWRPDD